jgi:hypothetical protein
MNRSELSQRRQRLQRKLAATFQGWHSGRVDRLEEALRATEQALGRADCSGSRAREQTKLGLESLRDNDIAFGLHRDRRSA